MSAAIEADAPPAPSNRWESDRFPDWRVVRNHTESLAAALTPEDQCVQSMADASPAKWHRAHTTWFFEEFVLRPHLAGYIPFDGDFRFLFNSYYETVGARQPRAARGLITRPGAEAVTRYRAHVDAGLQRLATSGSAANLMDIMTLGLQHEQQHQELLVTDILHAFSLSPLYPAALPDWQEGEPAAGPTRFVSFAGGVAEVGHDGYGFSFDNEGPRHRVLLQPYALADRPVRNAEWAAFIADGGYKTPLLWMSDGWAVVQQQGWTAPAYWLERDGQWLQMGPGGLRPLAHGAAVRHVSWYEADAFARWAGARLPKEAEWEVAATDVRLHNMRDLVWQWTASAYSAYPGFHPTTGAIGEYNGKFMVNQMVLRGGSVMTPAGHLRDTYRNFFHPEKRWQFSGLRLAKDL